MIAQAIKHQVLPWVVYPLVITLAIVLHVAMVEREIVLPVSTYLPVIIGALVITWLEFFMPYRQQWRPASREVKNDILYMLLVQILLARLLAFAVALLLLRITQNTQSALEGVWLHDWPVALQVVVMIVGAEFMRYWVHRLAHTWSPLWRLHAVHHSPDKLYWLNTGRFHPLEKTIQFLFDSLPFILMGVSAEVLALYFVFYAINGFFQHSNINLKFGILNYVISSAELHRWHHARDIEESGKNYGNNVILWDLVFGSWFLPKDRQVENLGLFNNHYPMRFRDQLKTPFTAGIDKQDIPLLGVQSFINNCKTQTGIFIANLIYQRPFLRALQDPIKYQDKLLLSIVRNNSNTTYGREHQFTHIHSFDDFTEKVPIQDYEAFRPYIEKQELDKTPALTAEQPHYYAQTSGTTGSPKHIPVINDTLKQHQRSLAIFACVQNKAQRHSFSGRLLTIPGPYAEGTLPGGTTFGSISGLLYRKMPSYLQRKYVVPEAVFSIKDHALKYRLILRLALPHKNLTYLVSANPSTFLKLVEVLNTELVNLANEIEQGSFENSEQLPGPVRKAVMPLLDSNSVRADELRQLSQANDSISLAHVWPNLRLVVTWTGGSCGVAVSALKKLLPTYARILELGYLSSELRATITLDDTESAGVPTLGDNVFEFIETDLYDEGIRETVRLDKLVEGKQYYIIVTTSSGLYRYFMNDIVEVTGFKRRTPLLKFIQKGKGVTNITGEKLTEHQLVEAVEKAKQDLQIDTAFYMALAYVEQGHYKLYIEQTPEQSAEHDIDPDQIAKTIDTLLKAGNIEYDSKRASQRLKPLTVRLLKPGTAEAYKTHCINKGQRESQYKVVLLQYRKHVDFPIENHCMNGAASSE